MIGLFEALAVLILLHRENVRHRAADLVGRLGEEVALVADDPVIIHIAAVVAEGEGRDTLRFELERDRNRIVERLAGGIEEARWVGADAGRKNTSIGSAPNRLRTAFSGYGPMSGTGPAQKPCLLRWFLA